MEQDNLTNKQLGPNGLSKWAVFLPAISTFYATFIGKQRVNNDYVDPKRFPAGLKSMEELNWLNSKEALFPYKWSLQSGGHADLDLTRDNPAEDMTRKRESGTFLLGDSGGFQIATCQWPGDWRAPNSPAVLKAIADAATQKTETRTVTDKNGKTKTVEVDLVKEQANLLAAAQKKREEILKWLDGHADYSMILDIPVWVTNNPLAVKATKITNATEAVEATKFNNEFFMKHRKGVKNGGTKFLNVLQGANHGDADNWYNIMKEYNDPVKYPDTHFDGWAMGGQNMCDVHLILKRLIALRYDNLLQEGKHDWMHFLGTSKLEWAVLLTVIQNSVRKYVNPSFTISFDCASPFLATANGQIYHHIDLPHNGKWTYRMSPSIDDKKYSLDQRSFRDVAMSPEHVAHFKHFDESPISALCKISDICIYKPGVHKTEAELAAEFGEGTPFDVTNKDHYSVAPDLNKIDKVGKTSWDSFSYALQMGHNVWTHIHSVQEANKKFENGTEYPAMLRHQRGDYAKFQDIVESIFGAPDRASAEAILESYSDTYWFEIVGTRGKFKGKNTKNATTFYHNLFEEVEPDDGNDDDMEFDQDKLDELESE